MLLVICYLAYLLVIRVSSNSYKSFSCFTFQLKIFFSLVFSQLFHTLIKLINIVNCIVNLCILFICVETFQKFSLLFLSQTPPTMYIKIKMIFNLGVPMVQNNNSKDAFGMYHATFTFMVLGFIKHKILFNHALPLNM